MAKIVYGVCGEGRGHAARCRAIVEALRPQHQVHIHAAGHAFDFLAPLYADVGDVIVEETEGLRFGYRPNRTVSPIRTTAVTVRFGLRLPGRVRHLARAFERDGVDLAITDFDPVIPRAARKAGVPCIAVDHQSMFAACDLSALPPYLRSYSWAAAYAVNAVTGCATTRLVSAFYRPPLRRRAGDVERVGVMLRPEMRRLTPERGDHLCVYVRRHFPDNFLEGLRATGLPVRIYGLGKAGRRDNVTFCAVDAVRFLEDLASCRALVCTAGNQLVGEAFWLGKPVLGIPEQGNTEQRINAWFLDRTPGGQSMPIRDFSESSLGDFLERFEGSAAPGRRFDLDGTEATLEAIRRRISTDAWSVGAAAS